MRAQHEQGRPIQRLLQLPDNVTISVPDIDPQTGVIALDPMERLD
jgi:hypothetical protein